jgi:ethanolamine utilization protein EutN
MHLGRVVGTVVATTRSDGLDGVKFLIVQPLDKHQRDHGSPVIAADAVAMAGTGELVYYVASREAAEAMPERFVPVDHAIVGLVDTVDLVDNVGLADADTRADDR